MNIITVAPGLTASIAFEGYFYNRLNAVYLSASDTSVFPYISVVNLFPSNTALATVFPQFSGYPWQNYTIIDSNRLQVNVYNNEICSLDVILINNAGYTKLSSRNYLISVSAAPVFPLLNIPEFNGVLNLFNDNNLEVIL